TRAFNPASAKALVKWTTGGLHIARPTWKPESPPQGGVTLHGRLRYFDPARRRAGLPQDVAALVHSLGDTQTQVTLVNTGDRPRRVIVQGGAYGEHRIESVQLEGREHGVGARHFTLDLAPGAGARLPIGSSAGLAFSRRQAMISAVEISAGSQAGGIANRRVAGPRPIAALSRRQGLPPTPSYDEEARWLETVAIEIFEDSDDSVRLMARFFNKANPTLGIGQMIAGEIVSLEKQESPAPALVTDGVLVPVTNSACQQQSAGTTLRRHHDPPLASAQRRVFAQIKAKHIDEIFDGLIIFCDQKGGQAQTLHHCADLAEEAGTANITFKAAIDRSDQRP
ncbi:hypothetical protein E4T56_gene15031, partial [Termitomyces sp. T112]